MTGANSGGTYETLYQQFADSGDLDQLLDGISDHMRDHGGYVDFYGDDFDRLYGGG